MEDENEYVWITLKSWLSQDEKSATVPDISGNRFHRMVHKREVPLKNTIMTCSGPMSLHVSYEYPKLNCFSTI